MKSAISLIVGAALAGCTVVTRPLAEWKVIQADGPWGGPGQRAALESRSYKVLADFSAHDERWHAPNGKTVDAWQQCERVVDYLEATGELARWPRTQASNMKGTMRLGPYQLYLVSVFPDVVLLVPHDYGSLNRSIYDLVGDGYKSLGDLRIMNHIHYGTSVPGSPQFYWMSAQLSVPLTPVNFDALGGFTISHPKVELVGRPEGGDFGLERRR